MCFWRGRGPPLCTNKADRCRIGEISLMKDLTKTMEISMREMEEQEARRIQAKLREPMREEDFGFIDAQQIALQARSDGEE